jgi:UDP-N-acetylglucosamine--N-acetylmuramyl-(pentapeptide) pyrophosphoryl-undecaprenol N-acetylglucosamine transferase
MKIQNPLKFLKKYTKHQVAFICTIWLCRVLLLPLFVFINLHKLIIYPRKGKYFFKKIDFFSIITTGGTGGHLFLAIRMASYIGVKGQNIRIVTNKNALPLFHKLGYTHKGRFFYTEEANECPNAIQIVSLKIQPLKKNIHSISAFIHAMMQSLWFFITRGALIENIIGFGGYVSFPSLFWGCVFGKKIYIHEQNTIFGKVNKLFIPFAQNIFTTFSIEEKPVLSKIINTGIPLQKTVEQRGFIKKTPSKSITFLVMSGSSGGGEATPSILSAIVNFTKKYKERTVTVMHQATGDAAKTLKEAYIKHNISYTIQPFFDNIHTILPTIDLCISRSGASSIIDLLSCGVPTIFIPLKNSADNHQLKNAAWVVQNNLGFMHKPWESNFYNFTALIYFALTASRRLNISKNGQIAIKRNARSLIYDHIF